MPTRVRGQLILVFVALAVAIPHGVTAIASDGSSSVATSRPAAHHSPPSPTTGVTVYPDPSYGTVDCDAGTFNGRQYAGNLKLIKALDSHTVQFRFCQPDGAFLSQVAFPTLAIDDAAYLIKHASDRKLLFQPNGTGPYELASWDAGNKMDFVANPNYWGRQPRTPNLRLEWDDRASARDDQLLSGMVDGIDDPDPNDISAIKVDPGLAYLPRDGLNTFYVGMNNTYAPWNDVRVRKAIAMGIDRKAIVDRFYSPGSQVAKYFTPCDIPFACGGDPTWTYDPVQARQLLAAAGYPHGFHTKIQFRASVRSYLPDPSAIASEIAAELQHNLGIDATLDLQESATFLENNAAGKLDGLFLLGWGADFADTSDFLDYHFGPGSGVKFGNPYPALVRAIVQGDDGTTGAKRLAGYTAANDLIKKKVPAVIVAHGGSATAWQATVSGAYSSGLGLERFATMRATGSSRLTWMQVYEPISLYCGDEVDTESLRACSQVKESLYAYPAGSSLAPQPALATACTPNRALTVWTCHLRKGVHFQNGAAFGADDVILSYAAQWDGLSQLHVGDSGEFEYWPVFFGDYLNGTS